MKRFVSILLSIIISASAFTFVYAEEDYTKVLENIKAIFDIPDYEEFDYSVTDDIYNFTWSDDEKGSLYIIVDKNLNVCNYYKDFGYDRESGQPTIDQAQAQAIADEFLQKAAGDNYSLYQYNADETKKYTSQIRFVYDAYVNGYKVLNGSANIIVDMTEGEVINYDSYFADSDIDSSKPNIVSLDRAKNGFFENDNVSLVYKNVYENDTVTAKPLYIADSYTIDAVTGKVFEYKNDEYADEDGAITEAANAGEGYSAKSSLTEAEKTAVEKLKNAITVEEGLKLINDKFNISLDKDNVGYSYYTYKNSNKEYELSLYYSEDDCYFRANINSDRVITYMYYEKFEGNIFSGYDNIKALVNKLYPEADVPADIKTDKNINDNYRYVFYGEYEGIKDLESYAALNFDKDYNVKSISYSYNDAEHIKYTGSLTNNDIWNIALENNNIEPVYLSDGSLVYKFEKSFTIDANTGEYLDYSGRRPQAERFNKYTDVEGTWYEDMANTLISYGYSFAEDKFMGDKAVTGADVIQFFKDQSIAVYRDYGYNDKFKEYADNPEKEITKYEMAKIIVNEIGYEDIAQKAEFVRPFEDVDDENIGYVAVCKAFGIAKGENNRFNGSNAITRAEMAAMVYYSLDK